MTSVRLARMVRHKTPDIGALVTALVTKAPTRGKARQGGPARLMGVDEDLWVFGYGSLMWRPGFDFTERTLAVVRGYRRSLCVYSHHHRGTPERPGLVLGLDRGGACKGVAFRVAATDAESTIAYLRSREQVTMVYREIWVGAAIADGRRVKALSYAVDRNHLQYAGALALPEIERLVEQGVGVSGVNPDYVRNTYEHMRELGIADATLAALAQRFSRKPA